MRFANTVDLKNKTNKPLREVMKGNSVVITYRGKPAATLQPLSEDDLEDSVLEHSPKIKKLIGEAERDIKQGEMVPLEEYLAGQKK